MRVRVGREAGVLAFVIGSLLISATTRAGIIGHACALDDGTTGQPTENWPGIGEQTSHLTGRDPTLAIVSEISWAPIVEDMAALPPTGTTEPCNTVTELLEDEAGTLAADATIGGASREPDLLFRLGEGVTSLGPVSAVLPVSTDTPPSEGRPPRTAIQDVLTDVFVEEANVASSTGLAPFSGQETLELAGLESPTPPGVATFFDITPYVIVPEPASLSVLAVGGLALLRRRQRRCPP